MKCTKCDGTGERYSQAWHEDVESQPDNGCIDYLTMWKRASERHPPIICSRCKGTGEEA